MTTPRKPSHGGSSAARRKAALANSGRQSSTEKQGSNLRAVWLAFVVAGVGYLVLSQQQPAGWGVPLWAALAFLLIPALAGLAINRLQSPHRPPKQAFLAGMKGVGWSMFFYSSITLTVLANRVGGAGNVGEEFLAGLLTAIVFTLLAGCAAGLTNVLLTGMLSRRSDDGPAS